MFSWAYNLGICFRGHMFSSAYIFVNMCFSEHILHGHMFSWAYTTWAYVFMSMYYMGICFRGHMFSWAYIFVGVCFSGHIFSWFCYMFMDIYTRGFNSEQVRI